MQQVIEYIIEILLGEENIEFSKFISYGKDKVAAQIEIVPSGFFEQETYLKKESMPKLPFQDLNGVPILYGQPRIEREGDKITVYADIVAGTYFLITRYEEYINRRDRDVHGRFLGKNSILYQGGCLMRPLVDEYRELLQNCLLELKKPVKKKRNCFKKVFLTHDVDQIWNWRNLYSASRTFLKRILTGKKYPLESILSWINYEKYDKIYTFPWLVEQDNKLRDSLDHGIVNSIYFFLGGQKGKYDFGYIDKEHRVKKLEKFLKKEGAIIGLHASYIAGENPHYIKKEKKKLEKIFEINIESNRNHYLASREPEDMRYLAQNHIKNDFTMGYADTVGFRLGTCHPVRWIDPIKLEVTELVLHPLSIMDCTLDGEAYMGLAAEMAYDVVCQMVKQIYTYGGELVLLWHNTNVAENAGNYQRELYKKTLSYVERIMKNGI